MKFVEVFLDIFKGGEGGVRIGFIFLIYIDEENNSLDIEISVLMKPSCFYKIELKLEKSQLCWISFKGDLPGKFLQVLAYFFASKAFRLFFPIFASHVLGSLNINYSFCSFYVFCKQTIYYLFISNDESKIFQVNFINLPPLYPPTIISPSNIPSQPKIPQ